MKRRIPPVHRPTLLAVGPRAVLAVALLAAGCGDARAEADAVSPPVVEVSKVARTLSDEETAGPLERPVALVAGADGVWVLDAGAKRVIFLRDGAPPMAVGREGAGPGEFKDPRTLHPAGASRVLVWDPWLGRSTELSGSGAPPKTERMDVLLTGLALKHALPAASGGLLGIFDKSADALNPPVGEQGSRGVLARVRSGSVEVDTLATFPLSGPVIVRESRPGGGVTLTAFSAPFDAEPHSDATAACGGFSAVSVGGRGFELHFFDAAGARLGVLRQPLVGARITAEERERYFAQFSGATLRRGEVERQVKVPERHPALHAVRLTATGHVWVRLTPPATAREETAAWRVWPVEDVRAGALRLGAPVDVRLPGRFSVQDVRGGEVWGFFYDADDVPHVRAYRLPRPLGRTCASE